MSAAVTVIIAGARVAVVNAADAIGPIRAIAAAPSAETVKQAGGDVGDLTILVGVGACGCPCTAAKAIADLAILGAAVIGVLSCGDKITDDSTVAREALREGLAGFATTTSCVDKLGGPKVRRSIAILARVIGVVLGVDGALALDAEPRNTDLAFTTFTGGAIAATVVFAQARAS